MKKFLLLSTILITIIGCSVSKKPEFKYVDNIKVKNISMRNITLNADVIFENPNNLTGKLSIEDIHIFVDNIDVGVISSQEFDVPSKDEFAIPLQGTFSLSKIYKENKKGLLGNVLNAIIRDSINIQYQGVIKYHLGSFSYPYKINKEQKIPLQ
ncbi:hypothetical protein [Aquimarina sp. 2201CG5-10]|uniref:hypothetical protein n=1 Tax=Aquimarina callyspongiae TaxID=3098150 RepID=UPI002AB3A623|nr:hypothetical protein [Aquimarina sp. 2201CG5-10]MDY8138280.1 hypothetical protein [Aquimarina sp. 2201CG5-10]